MKATFENTVDILVKAYLNDTLKHSDCKACAVGNIISHCMDEPLKEGLWRNVFVTTSSSRSGTINPQTWGLHNYNGEAKEQIDSTGYSVYELAKIENTFENIPFTSMDDYYSEERMFKGLMAVVDVLAEIHNVDLSVKESAKAMFVKL